MMRNDYRRSLILLRSNVSGYSGHVRLERRTLMGSMYFLLQIPSGCGELRAALAGRGRESYYACELGVLQTDNRGQAMLSVNYDPRNICGRELEQYQLLVVSCTDESGCRVVLYGNVCGHAQLDWQRVQQAVCALGRGEGIAPRAGELTSQEEAPVASLPEDAPTEQGEAQAAQLAEEVREAETEVLDELTAAAEAEAQAPSPEEAESAQLMPEEATSEEAEAAQPAAGELLGTDLSLPWPDAVEPLRAIMQAQSAMENPPDDELVYVEVPMSADSGYPYCAAGVRVENGAPISVRYALPATWTQEPPAGMEDYIWLGDQNRGWWVTEVPLDAE